MTSFCPYVDDSIEEAIALANQLSKIGISFEIRPIRPAGNTIVTARSIISAKPEAAMVDYYLKATPECDSGELVHRLLDDGIRTVFVTKDRDAADQGSINYRGLIIPIYSKNRLLKEQDYKAKMIQNLRQEYRGGGDANWRDRAAYLEEKEMLKTLSKTEKDELVVLLSRLQLEEAEEAALIAEAQSVTRQEFNSFIESIRQLTADLNKEIDSKHEISKKRKRT